MADLRTPAPPSTRRQRIFLRLGGVFLLFILVLAATAALLPAILSSASVQEMLRPRLAAALGRSVEWERLEFSWRDGVEMENLRLGDGPAPLRQFSVETAQASFGGAPSELMPVQLFLNLRLSGVTAAVEPAPQAAEEPEEPAADPEEVLANLAAQLQKVLDLGWDLPIDLRVLLDIGPASLNYRDPGSGSTAIIEDLFVSARIPSLLSQPISIESTADLAVNGHRLPSFRFSSGVSGLATLDGHLRPAGALFDVKIDLPGADAELQGSLAGGSGLTGALRLHPAQLFPLLQPFVDEPLPQAGGTLAAKLRSAIDGAGDLRLHLEIRGDSLLANGGPLASRSIGPLSFTLRQQIVTDHRRDTVSIEKGEISAPALLEARWQSTIEHPLSPRRRLSASVGPLVLHLQPLFAVARPFLPAELPPFAVTGRLECDAATYTATGGEKGAVALRGLRLLVDRLAARLPAGEVAGEDLRLEVTAAEIPLAAGFPTAANVHLDWHLGKLRLGGEMPVELAGAPGTADVAVTDVKRAPASPFGMTANALVKQRLALASLQLPDFELSGIEEKITVSVSADPRGDLEIALQSFALAAKGRPTVRGHKLAPFAAGLQLDGAKILLPAAGAPTVTGARLRLDWAPGGTMSARLDYTPEGSGSVQSDGELTVDAGALAGWLAPLLPSGVGGQGEVDLVWRLAARLPGADFVDPRVGNPVQQARRTLDLLTAAELTLNVKEGAVTLGELSPLAASGIATPKPLRLIVRDGAQHATFELVATVARLTGLPGAADLPPQRVRLALQGEQRNLATAHISEELQVEPAGVAQVSEIVVDKLDRLAALPDVPTAADLLRRLDASLFATLEVKAPERLPAMPAPLALAGSVDGGLRVDLDGGKQLRVSAFGDLNDADLRLPDGQEITGLNLRLLYNRVYAIGDRQHARAPTPWLSETVLATAGTPPAAASLLTERLWQDLRGVSGRERSLTFGRVRAKVAGFPLELTAGEGALQLDGLQPGIHYLQTGLLGGTLKARAGLDLAAAQPRAELFCTFSHLDTARLLPPAATPEAGADAEITGELALQLPLVDDGRRLLEQLELRLNLWQIGARTLERALFALDPYEQNEAIIEQRKMLRRGSLKSLQVVAADGSLSTAGEIEVGGVRLDLPRVQRLNLAGLPLESRLAKPLQEVPKLLSLLDLATADTLEIGEDGTIALRRSGNRE